MRFTSENRILENTEIAAIRGWEIEFSKKRFPYPLPGLRFSPY